MLPLDEQHRYEQAWRGRRWRLWGLLLALVILGLGLREIHDPILGAVCLAGMVAAIVWFYRFRCPRCGEPFVKWRTIFSQVRAKALKCQHCDLSVNEIPGARPY